MQYVEITYETTDPDALTAAVRMSPTSVRLFARRQLENGKSVYAWALRSDVAEENIHTGEHLQRLFEQMAPAWNEFVRIGIEIEPCISIVMHLYAVKSTPAFGLDQEQFRKMYELNAVMDVDMYILETSDLLPDFDA